MAQLERSASRRNDNDDDRFVLPPRNAVAALQIRKEAFRAYVPPTTGSDDATAATAATSSSSSSSYDATVEGIVRVHLFCGRGLVSSRASVQDLYAVVEVDSEARARTGVRTSASNFDWDEAFDVDVSSARTMSFMIYSRELHRRRHSLCFGAAVSLPPLFRQPLQRGGGGIGGGTHSHRLAVKLEPGGVLYVELGYSDVADVYRRTPSVHLDAVFGTELDVLVDRERTGDGVPLLVRRCVDELERRGVDSVGLYRKNASVPSKRRLREELEKNVRSAGLSVTDVCDISAITGTIDPLYFQSTVRRNI